MKQEEYVNQEELDDIVDENGEPLINDDNDLKNIDASLDIPDTPDKEDSIGSEEDSADRGGNAKTDLRRALQGGGDDRNDE